MTALLLVRSLIFSMVLVSAYADVSTIDLQPERQFVVQVPGAAAKGAKIREMRATTDTLWFLAQTDATAFSLVATDLAGQIRSVTPVTDTGAAFGLAITPRGIVTIATKEKQGTLIEFSKQGAMISQSRLPCYGADWLFAFNGNAATTCADGTVTEHKGGDVSERRASWIRPGSLAEPLSTGEIAIVDQATGTAIINDLNTSTITTVPRVPDIEKALQKLRGMYEQAAKDKPAGSPMMGRPLTVMDTAHDSSGWYVLVWPYQVAEGPLVVKLSNKGEVLARLRCRVRKPTDNLTKIEISNGNLLLGSIGGEVLRYQLHK